MIFVCSKDFDRIFRGKYIFKVFSLVISVNCNAGVNMTQHNVSAMNDSDSEDGEISVGCPSPVNIVNAIPDEDEKMGEGKEVDEEDEESPKVRKRSSSDDERTKEGCDEYFKPLKKLKMMNLSKKRKEDGKERSSPNSIPLAKQYPIHKVHLPTTSRLEPDEEVASMMPMNHFPNFNLVPPAHLGIPIPIPVTLRHFPTPGVLIDGRSMLLENRNLLEHRQLLERNLFLENRHLFERNLVENRLVDQKFLLNPADPRHLLTAADTRHLLTPEQRNLLGIENRLFEKSLIDHRQLLEARMLETRLAEGRLGMMENRERDGEKMDELTNPGGQNGVKSFSILDILNHRPKAKEETKTESGSKIVRPWDSKAAESAGKRSRPKSADFCYSETLSTCSSDRSSTAGSLGGSGSDCCTSPDIINCTVSGTSGGTSRQQQRITGKSSQGKNTSPLDALFQMTNKTFDGMNGETSGDGQTNHLHLFNNRQQPKKKRKSRTAFTNHQIFELEKRFLYQKYLSPADRDEIAGALGLSNAQVITWFQNRRAKLKRDMEELKKDVESAKILTAHKSFLENVQDLGILKKKNVPSHSDDEKTCSVPNLVIPVVSTDK